MVCKLPYGRGNLEIELSSGVTVIEEKYVEGLKNEKAEFIKALRNPIYSLPLREICNYKWNRFTQGKYKRRIN